MANFNEEWTRLVQQVDLLIQALRESRLEVKKWQSRATELERLKTQDSHIQTADYQAKDRELERLRKDRKKIAQTVQSLIQELDEAQKQVLEKEND